MQNTKTGSKITQTHYASSSCFASVRRPWQLLVQRRSPELTRDVEERRGREEKRPGLLSPRVEEEKSEDVILGWQMMASVSGFWFAAFLVRFLAAYGYGEMEEMMKYLDEKDGRGYAQVGSRVKQYMHGDSRLQLVACRFAVFAGLLAGFFFGVMCVMGG